MKRAGLILIAAVLTALIVAPFGLDGALGSLGVSANIAAAASPTPTPPPDPLSSASGPVCVAVPVFANAAQQGACPAGQQEIPNDQASGGAIIFYLKLILKLLNLLVGGIIVLVIVIAGIQYIISAGDPANVKKAKGRIMNAITALILYLLMFAILNFLIPGGIL
jgi:hypothetical protein